MSGKLNLTELDFDTIKANLRSFLESQPYFQDYNWEGSGLSYLLDLLAYNTHYTAFYANMVASEMFLDSAILRNSVVSRAKAIGYTPRSKKAARATLDVTVTVTGDPLSFVIARDTKFSSVKDGVTYNFVTVQDRTITKSGTSYPISGLEVYEGKWLEYKFTVKKYLNPDQRFIIPNSGVDTDHIIVEVQPSATDSTKEIWTKAEDITEIESTSKVYFLQEIEDNQYEIYFGDGNVGEAIQDGNIITVTYLVTHGTAANGCSTFRAASQIGGFAATSITTVTNAENGLEEETIESIKYLAPKNYEAQSRAVTRNDYETILLNDYPYIDAIRVWGGEDNDPPMYGKVFIALKPSTGTIISERTRESLINTTLRRRNPVSIEVEIVDPEYTRLVVNSTVTYNAKATTKTAATLREEIIDAIISFSRTNINNFDSIFRYSQLIRTIDAIDTSILSNDTSINLKYRLTPISSTTRYEIRFNNKLALGDITHDVHCLTSSAFLYAGYTCYFTDNGSGSIYAYRLENGIKQTVATGMGSIDYTTGKIILDDFVPTGYPEDDVTYIDFTVIPKNLDISPQRNQIIIIEEEDITVDLVNSLNG